MSFSWISIMSNPQWVTAIGTIFMSIATLFAVIIALYKDDWKKPLIKIGFGNESPYFVGNFWSNNGGLFRIRVVNKGKTVARNCQVKLLSVKSEEGENVLDKNEPDILKWSSAPRDMGFRADPPEDINLINNITQLPPIFREKKDITPRGGSEFCDVFCANTKKKLVFSSSGHRKFIYEKGKRYFAIIEILGDNFEPTKKEIKIYTPFESHFEDGTIVFFIAGIEGIRHLF